MNQQWNTLILMTLIDFSEMAVSQAVTGKIMIDGQEYSSGSSNIIRGSRKVVTEKRQLNVFNRLFVNIAADVDNITSDSYHVPRGQPA